MFSLFSCVLSSHIDDCLDLERLIMKICPVETDCRAQAPRKITAKKSILLIRLTEHTPQNDNVQTSINLNIIIIIIIFNITIIE